MMRHVGPFLLAFTVLALIPVAPLVAAPFRDLNFEQATLEPVEAAYPYWVYTASAMPSWTVTYTSDNSAQDTLDTNFYVFDTTAVTLITQSVTVPGWPMPLTGDPVQGDYSVQLSGVIDQGIASISQTGDVPAAAKSISFDVRAVAGTSTIPYVSLGGTMIDVFPVSTSGGITLMEGDISAFAGTTGELTFTAAGMLPKVNPGTEDVYDLDDISFSPNPIPEPASAALLLAALPLLTFRRRRV